MSETTQLKVPFFRPSITDAEIDEVVRCLKSGWLTSGPRVKEFEESFATAVRARHAVALNSCTAALHLAVEALELGAGQAVLVPTMTFAATAEVVRYQGAIPILVDCDPVTLNMDLTDAEEKIAMLRKGEILSGGNWQAVGIMPVHVGGSLLDLAKVAQFAQRHGLWIVEDAAHAFPAAMRQPGKPWQRCGESTADITCFSFYANKTITTGEGGMAVTEREGLADRMRQMSLHGLTHNAWNRFQGSRNWDYRIVAPGYKYNLTDIAASIGIHQVRRAEELRLQREAIAKFYRQSLEDLDEIELPPSCPNRIHAWHLYPIRIKLEQLSLNRNQFIDKLRERGIGSSVHWRPLHLHPYYLISFGWTENLLPAASAVWQRLISLPLFPGMTEEEQDQVVRAVREICREHRLQRRAFARPSAAI